MVSQAPILSIVSPFNIKTMGRYCQISEQIRQRVHHLIEQTLTTDDSNHQEDK